MNLLIRAQIIPDIKKDPEQTLLMLEKHQEIQNGLKAFLRFLTEDNCYINLYNEGNECIITIIQLAKENSHKHLSRSTMFGGPSMVSLFQVQVNLS